MELQNNILKYNPHVIGKSIEFLRGGFIFPFSAPCMLYLSSGTIINHTLSILTHPNPSSNRVDQTSASANAHDDRSTSAYIQHRLFTPFPPISCPRQKPACVTSKLLYYSSTLLSLLLHNFLGETQLAAVHTFSIIHLIQLSVMSAARYTTFYPYFQRLSC